MKKTNTVRNRNSLAWIVLGLLVASCGTRDYESTTPANDESSKAQAKPGASPAATPSGTPPSTPVGEGGSSGVTDGPDFAAPEPPPSPKTRTVAGDIVLHGADGVQNANPSKSRTFVSHAVARVAGVVGSTKEIVGFAHTADAVFSIDEKYPKVKLFAASGLGILGAGYLTKKIANRIRGRHSTSGPHDPPSPNGGNPQNPSGGNSDNPSGGNPNTTPGSSTPGTGANAGGDLPVTASPSKTANCGPQLTDLAVAGTQAANAAATAEQPPVLTEGRVIK